MLVGLQYIILHYKYECTERVQWSKNLRHWSTEMLKKVIYSDESFFTIFLTSESVHGAAVAEVGDWVVQLSEGQWFNPQLQSICQSVLGQDSEPQIGPVGYSIGV